MFQGIRHFTPDEWPNGVLAHIDPALIGQLDELRERLGRPIYPSPLAGAWTRFDGSSTSRHYAVGRLADAGDVFPEGDIRDAWLAAQALPFGGIGVYFDTTYQHKPWPMLHLDLRPERVLWARIGRTRYIYPARGQAERDLFFDLLANHAGARAA